ncbi:PQQ-binding-like beta-propeller repeat protein [Plantactinospora sp. GCM10030261]|uniref:outer membrane protein assembly factor BamB family protein n=1 Tax=Plantactinospora sp. GCM10030261 TaxID=3273420 RepID=UPI00361A9849
MGTTSRSRGLRILAAAATAVLALAATGAVAYRVFAPAEVLAPARVAAYPSAPTSPVGVRGTLPAAPLIVAGRIRVTAADRQVSADGPIDAKYRNSPYWSYRRWPAELTGVLAVAPADDADSGESRVVTRWSDGEVVALDARTGQVAWRASGPATDSRYAGRRTGAETVYHPPGLRLARTAQGVPVLTVAGRTELRGLDPASGRQLWRAEVPAACRVDELTSTAGQLIAVDACATPRVLEFRDPATGAVQRRWRPEAPAQAATGEQFRLVGLGCGAGSDCPAIRLTVGGDETTADPDAITGWLVDRPEPVRAPDLDTPESTVVDGLVVSVAGGQVLARPVRGGEPRWRHRIPADSRLLAVQPGRVHLVDPGNELLTLDSTSGDERSKFDLRYADDGIDWTPGEAYAAAGLVMVERLTPPVDPAAPDTRYYSAARPVILAVT